jgi:hypothetical protein
MCPTAWCSFARAVRDGARRGISCHITGAGHLKGSYCPPLFAGWGPKRVRPGPRLSDNGGPGPIGTGGKRRTASGKCPLIASSCPDVRPQLGISSVLGTTGRAQCSRTPSGHCPLPPNSRDHHERRASLSSASSLSALSRSRSSCSRSVDCVIASSSLWPSKRPSWRWRSSTLS